MADLRKRLPQNVPGEFFVDSTCIDCDTCRQVAPADFAEGPDAAFVIRQPQTDEERRDALRALVCCPTGSIGTVHASDAKSVIGDFPLPVEDDVWWDRDERRLGASRDYCWDSWADQIESMAALANHRFEWVLPGHGQRVHLSADTMRTQLLGLVERMRSSP